jgi:hypothetical protein
MMSCAKAVIRKRLRPWTYDLFFSHFVYCVQRSQPITIKANSTAKHDTYQKEMLPNLLFYAFHCLAHTVVLGP